MKRKIEKLSRLASLRGHDLSIITATRPNKKRPHDSLERAWESIQSQAGDYRWEWIIQVDGGRKALKKTKERLGNITDDRRVRLRDNSRHLGQAITRNLALQEARGAVTIYLDDDDELAEGAFRTWLEPLEEDWSIGWSAGQLVDVKEERLTESRSYLPLGRLERGEFFDYWLSPERGFPHPPSCFAVRTHIARLNGGWQALPQGEDFGWALSATFYAPGEVSPEPVYLYHKHGGNMMDRRDFNVLESKIRNIVWDRGIELSLDLARDLRPQRKENL